MRKQLILGIGVVFMILVLMLLLVNFRTSQIRNNPPRGNNIVTLGDSLTVGVGDVEGGGWVPVTEQITKTSITRIARSGATTEDALSMLDQVHTQKPDVAIIFLGGNDALQRLPVDATFTNLKKIIDALKTDGVFVVLVGVRGGIIGDRYRDTFERLAKTEHVALVPGVLDDVFGNPSRMSEDGIHPNAAGYKIIGEKIGNVVSTYISPQR